MYSLLLMTAMAGSPEAPTFGNTLLGRGCGGCSGVVLASCGGSCTGSACYGGSYYSACTGCVGASCSGYGCGGLFSGLHARLGGVFHGGCGYSSCGGYTACSGACYGSCSGYLHNSCSGCGGFVLDVGHTAGYYYGCAGSTPGGCYGQTYYSAYGGCYGSCVGNLAPYHGTPVYPTYSAPAIGTTEYTPGVIVGSAATGMAVAQNTSRYEGGTGGVLASAPPADTTLAPAKLTLEMPPLAVLYVDDVPVAGDGKSEVRQFHTPDLVRGKQFFYELRAVLIVDGKLETETKKVVVKAGDKSSEAFPKLIAAAKTLAAKDVVTAGGAR